MNWRKFLIYLVNFVVITCCLLLLASRFAVFGVRLFSVQSGSMEPAIQTGSMVVVKPMPSYEIGDIITYYDREDNKKTITHRLVKQSVVSGITQMVTWGDANDAADALPVTPDLVIGKTLFSIPLFGYMVGFAKTTPGFIIFIVIPITLIVYEEIRKINEEAKKIVSQRREKKRTQKAADNQDSEKK